jgi:hypothetical protein
VKVYIFCYFFTKSRSILLLLISFRHFRFWNISVIFHLFLSSVKYVALHKSLIAQQVGTSFPWCCPKETSRFKSSSLNYQIIKTKIKKYLHCKSSSFNVLIYFNPSMWRTYTFQSILWIINLNKFTHQKNKNKNSTNSYHLANP